MLNRRLIATTLIGVLNVSCSKAEYPYQQPDPVEQAARARRTELEQRYRNLREAGQHLAAAQILVDEQLIDDDKDREELARHLASHAGAIEGADPLARFGGYTTLARLAKRAELPDDVVKRYAASAFRAGVGVDNPAIVANAALIARVHDVELDGYWRAAARVWALRIEQAGWPDAEAQAFITVFPLSGNLATTAFDAAMELGRWKAARMIAERAQLGEQQFRAARAKEVEDLVAAAIQARDDQRLLALSLEAPGFVDPTVIRTVTARVVAKLLEEGYPGEAYALTLDHGLDVVDAKRAADAFFAAAIKARTFSLARQMPDGSLLIVTIERVRPAPTAPATNTASSRVNDFEGGGGGH